MQAVQSSLAAPVRKYLEALEIELKKHAGVSPEEALSDAREHLQNVFDAMNRSEPGQDDDDVFAAFVECFGSPVEIASAYGNEESPFPSLIPGYAPGWRIYCTSCGRSAPAGRAGITRIGAYSQKKFTLGFCRGCRWLRTFALTRDMNKKNLSRAMDAPETPRSLRGFGSPWIQKLLLLFAVFGILAVLGAFTTARDEQPKVFRNMPDGWTVQTSHIVDDRQRSAIADRLGVSMTELVNAKIAYKGQTLQINTLEAATEADAAKLEAKLRKGKTARQLVQRNGRTVYEFVARNKRDLRLALTARYALGIQPLEVRYKVTFNAAPLKNCDCMKWNKLFNLFLRNQTNPSEEVTGQIAAMAETFQFSDELVLSRYGIGAVETEQKFSQEATAANLKRVSGRNTFRFSNLNAQPGIGTVSIEMNITSQSGVASPEHRESSQRQHLTQPTDRWPVSDPEIQQLARTITASATNEQEKVRAILQWLTPGVNAQFGGTVTGSRYGVKKFLKQKFGRCWDFSDAFVTLSRATGVPTRQVYGWLHQSSGHVWAAVLIPGEGWKHVDPTASTSCGSDYIPITSSEDGEIPLLYTSNVEVEVVHTSNSRR